MSEHAVPDQKQLSELYHFGVETLQKNGLVLGHGAESQPKDTINGQPFWPEEHDFNFEFSVASTVLQQLAPDHAEVLGISIDNATHMVTNFAYEPLRQWAVPEPGEKLAHYLEGGSLVVASGIPDFAYMTMHTAFYAPETDRYVTDLHFRESITLVPEFEPYFNMRVHAAVKHMFSLLPQIVQLKF